MTELGVRTDNVTVTFGDQVALDGLDLRLAPGKIHGLLGRNGSGKSTLAAVLAGFRQPNTGRVLLDGGDLGEAREPYEDAVVTSRVCLIRESGDLYDATPVNNMVGLAASLRPYWDEDLAGELLDRFEIPMRKRVQKLSRGKKSAVGPAAAVDELTTGLAVLAEHRLGGTKSSTVLGDLDDTLVRQARSAGLEIGPVGLQDLFVHLTATKSKEGDR